MKTERKKNRYGRKVYDRCSVGALIKCNINTFVAQIYLHYLACKNAHNVSAMPNTDM